MQTKRVFKFLKTHPGCFFSANRIASVLRMPADVIENIGLYLTGELPDVRAMADGDSWIFGYLP